MYVLGKHTVLLYNGTLHVFINISEVPINTVCLVLILVIYILYLAFDHIIFHITNIRILYISRHYIRTENILILYAINMLCPFCS